MIPVVRGFIFVSCRLNDVFVRTAPVIIRYRRLQEIPIRACTGRCSYLGYNQPEMGVF